jgi:hypothetical protein
MCRFLYMDMVIISFRLYTILKGTFQGIAGREKSII